MKSSLLVLLLGCMCGSAFVQAAPPPRPSLRGAQCIDPARINNWRIIDDRTAVIRTGPKHYEITLRASCPQLRHPPGLIFRANSANASTNGGRICGEAGETVRSRGQPPCAIASIRPIDKARFDQLVAPGKLAPAAAPALPTRP